MLQAEIIESNEQLIKAYKFSLSKIPQHEIREREGISIIASNTDNIILNPILLSNPIRDETDLEARLTAIGDYIKKSKLPYWIIICEDFLPEAIKSRAKEIFARHELGFLGNLTGMAADKVIPFEKPIPELECRVIENLEMARSVAEINAIANNLSLESFWEVLGREELWGKRAFASLGYVEGKPVSTALTLENEGRLYVGWVATLPEYCQKGYAKKVVSHAVATATENSGIYSSVLHAKQKAFSVYQKLGYYPVSSFSTYTLTIKGLAI
jgi:ribosomal protein S18 acetylase RimI-like enzyme